MPAALILMRILGYNILKGGTGREEQIAEVLRAADADIVMLQEADRLASIVGIADEAGYPYYNARWSYSTSFMSRIPVRHRWHVVPLIRSPFLELVPEDMNIHIWGVHLTALLSTLTEHVRAREIRTLLQRVNATEPAVLIGDFNTLAPGDTFDKAAMPRFLQMVLRFSGGDIPRLALRQLLDAGYMDAYRQLYPAKNGWSLPAVQPNTRLDYAFLSPHLKDRLVDCSLITEPEAVRQASDHLPLLLEINP